MASVLAVEASFSIFDSVAFEFGWDEESLGLCMVVGFLWGGGVVFA